MFRAIPLSAFETARWVVFFATVVFFVYVLLTRVFPPTRTAFSEFVDRCDPPPKGATRKLRSVVLDLDEEAQDTESFLAGDCVRCGDEQVIHTSTIPLGHSGRYSLERRYSCNNCGQAILVRYELDSVARIELSDASLN